MKQQSFQVAFFLQPELSNERIYSLYQNINKKLINKFDDMPIINPANRQFFAPIIQTRSKDTKWLLNLSSNRTDLIVDTKTESCFPEVFFDENRELLKYYFNAVKEEASVIRCGFVFNLFKQEKNNVQKIYNKYLNSKKYCEKCIEVLIQTNERIQNKLFPLDINDIITIEAVSNPAQGIRIQIDINNVPLIDEKCFTEQLFDDLLLIIRKEISSKKLEEII